MDTAWVSRSSIKDPKRYEKYSMGGIVIGFDTQTQAMDRGRLHRKIIDNGAAMIIWVGIGRKAQNKPINVAVDADLLFSCQRAGSLIHLARGFRVL
tara:strand:+ start:807 stop:1094 length:288 start_codon:yes stop_codon:yes gene_type:complete